MESDKAITKYNNEIIKATNIYTKYTKGTNIGAILIIKNNREIYFMDEVYNKELSKFYSSHLIKWEIIKNILMKDIRYLTLVLLKIWIRKMVTIYLKWDLVVKYMKLLEVMIW